MMTIYINNNQIFEEIIFTATVTEGVAFINV